MKKDYKKIILFIIAILFGSFMVVYGERDDSPGAQFIGLIAFIFGVWGLVPKKYKKLSLKKVNQLKKSDD